METLTPRDDRQVLEAVAWAAASERPLEVRAGASKLGLGRPVDGDHTLDVSGLNALGLYEPEELVVSAQPGIGLATLERELAAAGQMLAFEPPDLGPLYGGAPGGATLGGVIACNLSGPRRVKDGAARDHLLGIAAVSGRGEAFKSGGRVVKNVTGYDLSKLMAGSFGTLAVFTELTVRALPRPEDTATVAVSGLGDAEALAALAAVLATPYEVAGAAHLPAAVADRIAPAALAPAGLPVTLVRLEGFAPSVAYRAERLVALLAARPGGGTVVRLDAAASRVLWLAIRDVSPFALSPGGDVPAGPPVWKLSIAADRAAAAVARIAQAVPVEAIYDWGGALVWLRLGDGGALPAGVADDAGARMVRGALGGAGHATLVRASAMVRAAVPVFPVQPGPLADLTLRVKQNFDTRRILNPGRMYADA